MNFRRRRAGGRTVALTGEQTEFRFAKEAGPGAAITSAIRSGHGPRRASTPASGRGCPGWSTTLRTYPNYLTREFYHPQSDAKRAFSPTGFCEQVFINMFAGPLGMCNGLHTLRDPAAERPGIFTNVENTMVVETARVMIVFSGLPILPDRPEA